MNMRAKFQLQSVEQFAQGTETLKFTPVSKKSAYPADGLDEDNTYAKFSPSGSLSLTVANPALIVKFKPGETFYLDFTKVEV